MPFRRILAFGWLSLLPFAFASAKTQGFYDLYGYPGAVLPLALEEALPYQVIPAPDFPVAPLGFRPAPNQKALLLLDRGKTLGQLSASKGLTRRTIRGGKFQPSEVAAVDFAYRGRRLAILDHGAGTLWLGGTDGTIERRLGLFPSPLRVESAGDQLWVVQDSEIGGVARVDSKRDRVEWFRGLDLVPGLVPDRGILWLRRLEGQRGAMVGVRSFDDTPMVTNLATLHAPEGEFLLHAEFAGIYGDLAYFFQVFQVQDDPRPHRAEITGVRLDGSGVQAQPVPIPTATCPDCGPPYRIGPDGVPWTMAFREPKTDLILFPPKEPSP